MELVLSHIDSDLKAGSSCWGPYVSYGRVGNTEASQDVKKEVPVWMQSRNNRKEGQTGRGGDRDKAPNKCPS